MQTLKSALKWILIAVAFFVVVGLLTMTGDKPPQDMDAASQPAKAPAK